MARAYNLAKGSGRLHDGMIWMVIEGPEHFIKFATKLLKKEHELVGLREPLEIEGEIREYFSIPRSRKHVFMADWKAAKAEYPNHIKCPRTTPGHVTPKPNGIEGAVEELEKAEAALQRAIARANGPERHQRSQKYLVKYLSQMRGGVRRSHRQLVVNTREAEELAAIFLDKACKHPRPFIVDKVPYRDPFGRNVSRDVCREAAIEHWGMCIKAHRLGCTIGPVKPDYAAEMIAKFGCLDMYLSFMKVGDVNAQRLPVIDKALAQLKALPKRINQNALLSAYEVAIEAVKEFTAWVEMVNAMYHRDVVSIVEGITDHQRYDAKNHAKAVALLLAMRSRMSRFTPEPEKKEVKSTPFTISVCAPEDDGSVCSSEEFA